MSASEPVRPASGSGITAQCPDIASGAAPPPSLPSGRRSTPWRRPTSSSWHWPGWQQYEWEVLRTRLEARREAERIRRRERREFIIEALCAAAFLAIAILLMWLLAPLFYPY